MKLVQCKLVSIFKSNHEILKNLNKTTETMSETDKFT